MMACLIFRPRSSVVLKKVRRIEIRNPSQTIDGRSAENGGTFWRQEVLFTFGSRPSNVEMDFRRRSHFRIDLRLSPPSIWNQWCFLLLPHLRIPFHSIPFPFRFFSDKLNFRSTVFSVLRVSVPVSCLLNCTPEPELHNSCSKQPIRVCDRDCWDLERSEKGTHKSDKGARQERGRTLRYIDSIA